MAAECLLVSGYFELDCGQGGDKAAVYGLVPREVPRLSGQDAVMFKFIRKVLIFVLVAAVAGVAYYYLRNPVHRRTLSQRAEEIREEIKDNAAKPVWTGTVVVVDALEGDKALVNTETNRGVAVHLAGIDAPEMGEKNRHNSQPLAEESRRYLASLIKDKAVEMAIVGTDATKSPIVLLTLDAALVNTKMVEAGLAEVSPEGFDALPAKIRHALENAELSAKEKRTNIWGLANYVRPVEYRIRQQKAGGLAGTR